MEYQILFHLDRAPTLAGLTEGGNAMKDRDLLEVEVMIIKLCISIGGTPQFDRLVHAKVCLELACCEYLKYIKTGKRSKRLLPLRPEKGCYPHSIQAHNRCDFDIGAIVGRI